jgi:hypothetical protein
MNGLSALRVTAKMSSNAMAETVLMIMSVAVSSSFGFFTNG